jgi:hypothetical protein
MSDYNQIISILATIGGMALLFVFMILLVIWARRRSIGAIGLGALMSVFAPDPVFEQKITLAEEAKQTHTEEEDEAEPK